MVKIISGGRLVFCSNTAVAPKTARTLPRTAFRDVSSKASWFMYEECILDGGVILKDIFILLHRNHNLAWDLCGDAGIEVIEEGLRPFKGDRDGELKCLELYWGAFYDPRQKLFHGILHPDFHALGRHKDERYALDFIPSNALSHLSVVLSKQFNICIQHGKREDVQSFAGPVYSLGHILYGVLGELSWHGRPAQRDKVVEAHLKSARRPERNIRIPS